MSVTHQKFGDSLITISQIPSYIKDTNHFINKVDNFSVPVNSVLVTMDVRSLYTSIPNNEGIAATKKRYDSYIHKTIPTNIITAFLVLILTLNNFVFNSKFYLQIKGCAMGKICAPAYANTFMAEFWTKTPLSVDKRQINSFLTLYWWYLYGMDQIWKTAKRFYKWTESKTSLYKVWLQIWLQANRVPRHFSLNRPTK